MKNLILLDRTILVLSMFVAVQVLNGNAEENDLDGMTTQHVETMASDFISKMNLEKASKRFDMEPLELADINTEDPDHEEEQIQQQIQEQDPSHNGTLQSSNNYIDENREYESTLPLTGYCDNGPTLPRTGYYDNGPALPPAGYYDYVPTLPRTGYYDDGPTLPRTGYYDDVPTLPTTEHYDYIPTLPSAGYYGYGPSFPPYAYYSYGQ